MAETEQTNLTTLTVDLLSAYFANNTVDSGDLSGLIRSTHEALKGIDSPPPETTAAPDFKPAVSVRASLASKDHIVSLIDGKAYKTLKRHLSTNGLTPAEYRERYKLPRDYPMVAPSYSQARRDVAARLGLGRKPGTAAPKQDEAPVETPAEAPAPVAAAPKTRKAAPKKSIAKAPAKDAAPPKRKAAPKIALVSTESVAPTVDETSSPAGVEAAAPKKAGRKPKAEASAPKSAVPAKTAAKRAPRKPKDPAEPAAG